MLFRSVYAKEAWAYFRKLCEEKSGEKIYKTFKGVKSVVVLKPLPPAKGKENYDQYWLGDPYSAGASDTRGEYAAVRLVLDRRNREDTGIQRGLEFVEMKDDLGAGYVRIFRPESHGKPAVRERVRQAISGFGVSWEDISTRDDRKYWVAGSRLTVVDLANNSIVAERIGYLIEAGFGSTAQGREPWRAARGIGRNERACPPVSAATDQHFITSIFRQDQE
mgnify:FL=1